ncbi:MAG: hypothetical protein WCT36_02600 [Candidatus Gracilibacteria bacterium]|jgi:hypothetical protein
MDERYKLHCDSSGEDNKGGDGRSNVPRNNIFVRLKALTSPFRDHLTATAAPSDYADIDICSKAPDMLARIALSTDFSIEKRRRAVELLGHLLDAGEFSAIKFLIQIADPNKLIIGTRYCPKIHDMAREILDKHRIPWKNCTILTDFRGERGTIEPHGGR